MEETRKNLYDLTSEQVRLMNCIEAMDGEITPEVAEELEINEANFNGKVESYIKVMQHYKMLAEAAKKEKSRVADLQKFYEKQIERLENNVVFGMGAFSKERVELGTCRLSLRHSQAVSIEDETMIPQEYMKVSYTADKAGIKEALKAGIEVAGARMVSNVSLQIK